jgi:DNA-binding transcriptional MocR family regulator
VGDREASHLWLRLPEGWRSDPFVQQAADRRVRITGAGTFAVSRHVPAGVRLSLGRPGTLEEMAAGLETIREMLEEGPVSSTTVI